MLKHAVSANQSARYILWSNNIVKMKQTVFLENVLSLFITILKKEKRSANLLKVIGQYYSITFVVQNNVFPILSHFENQKK